MAGSLCVYFKLNCGKLPVIKENWPLGKEGGGNGFLGSVDVDIVGINKGGKEYIFLKNFILKIKEFNVHFGRKSLFAGSSEHGQYVVFMVVRRNVGIGRGCGGGV